MLLFVIHVSKQWNPFYPFRVFLASNSFSLCFPYFNLLLLLAFLSFFLLFSLPPPEASLPLSWLIFSFLSLSPFSLFLDFLPLFLPFPTLSSILDVSHSRVKWEQSLMIALMVSGWVHSRWNIALSRVHAVLKAIAAVSPSVNLSANQFAGRPPVGISRRNAVSLSPFSSSPHFPVSSIF